MSPEEVMGQVSVNGNREWTDERVKQAMEEYAAACAKDSALKWYKLGVLDASPEGTIFDDGLAADFHERYGDQLKHTKR